MSHGRKAAERLSGKIVFITGASSGIGEATALEYLEATEGNIKLILTARRLARLQKLQEQILTKYPNAKVHIGELDVTQLDQVKPFLEGLPDEFKDIDILINNAGKALGTDQVGDIPLSDVTETIQTNVVGLINVTQAVLPIFKKKNSGDIVNLGSIAGSEAYPNGSIYCASKFAVRAFSDSLRKELINTKIRVILVAPGMVNTEFSLVRFKGDAEKADNVYRGVEPLYADDIADLIVYTTSRKSNVVITDSLVFPTAQASAQHIYRRD